MSQDHVFLSCEVRSLESNLSQQHENDIGAVEMKGCHHVLVEGDELIRRGVGSEEGGNERTQTPLLQDGL